jgi:hypothetical protein
MKRSALLSAGWVMAAAALYAGMLLLEVKWNLFNWRLQWDGQASLLVAWALGGLSVIWLLAGITRDRVSRSIALVTCLVLAAIAIYVLPPERPATGLFGRDAPSPLWYRGGRFLLMSLPAAFWILRRRHAKDVGAVRT